MTVSIIEKAASAFTDTSLPKFTRDPMDFAGTKYAFDFTNPIENANADGALATGATIGNMVDGGASATVAGTTNNLSNAAGRLGIVFPGTTSGSHLDLGAAGVYDRAVANHEFVLGLWFSPSGTATNANPLLQGPGGNRNNEQIYIDQGAGGVAPAVSVGGTRADTTTGTCTVTGASTLVVGHAAQVAMHWVPGASLRLFQGGALTGQTTTNVPVTLYSAASYALRSIDSVWKGTLLRVWEEDLVATRAADPDGDALVANLAAARVAADYAWYRTRLTALGIT